MNINPNNKEEWGYLDNGDKMKITIKNNNGIYGIYKDNELIDEEISLDKAKGAKEFYENYWQGGLNKNQAHNRFVDNLNIPKKGLGLFG